MTFPGISEIFGRLSPVSSWIAERLRRRFRGAHHGPLGSSGSPAAAADVFFGGLGGPPPIAARVFGVSGSVESLIRNSDITRPYPSNGVYLAAYTADRSYAA